MRKSVLSLIIMGMILSLVVGMIPSDTVCAQSNKTNAWVIDTVETCSSTDEDNTKYWNVYTYSYDSKGSVKRLTRNDYKWDLTEGKWSHFR